jgi:hypothetical protein
MTCSSASHLHNRWLKIDFGQHTFCVDLGAEYVYKMILASIKTLRDMQISTDHPQMMRERLLETFKGSKILDSPPSNVDILVLTIS